MQQLSDCSAGRINSHHAAAKAMRHAGYIDAATPGIPLWGRAAQLSSWLDVRNIDEDVYRWIDSDCDDVRHVRHPFRQRIRPQVNLAKRK
jgi:hypothetical protein